jgi:hypothetical protein
MAVCFVRKSSVLLSSLFFSCSCSSWTESLGLDEVAVLSWIFGKKIELACLC